ncbi:hypothetical protein K502DRAFT_351447 [Neoconidiobolus thromboides FSU 785]|nr:hypothetical protein K502DRAFT_351447 [Neoconidiobolus thromboides FSU 785]
MKLNNNICNKIIDHGYKYPCNHCFGYLISDSSGSVKRCIPALHIWLLNPGLELSYEMLKATLSKEENIIGFYYIDNNIPNNKKKQEIDLDSLSFIYKLILSDLNKVLSPIIIKANSNSLQDTVISQPFEVSQ